MASRILMSLILIAVACVKAARLARPAGIMMIVLYFIAQAVFVKSLPAVMVCGMAGRLMLIVAVTALVVLLI
jgi:hypothetical protein